MQEHAGNHLERDPTVTNVHLHDGDRAHRSGATGAVPADDHNRATRREMTARVAIVVVQGAASSLASYVPEAAALLIQRTLDFLAAV